MFSKLKWKRYLASKALYHRFLTDRFTAKIPSARTSNNYGNDNIHQYIVAHRGATGYAPENTMAAFQKAIEMKADFIELDVQMSEDGELVVIHDTTVNRTTNIDSVEQVMVKDLTVKELKQLDAGSYFGTKFVGEQIPTFEEVLDTFYGKIGFVIEIKAPNLYLGIEQKVAEILIERNLNKPCNGEILVQSFDFNTVKKLHELLPDVPRAVLTSKKKDLTDTRLKEFTFYADYVNTSRRLVTKKLVNKIHSLDMKIMTWTVRKKDQVAPLVNAGVDGIITDYPDYVPKNMHK
ncbi:glycerophosphodiester phosphodiesterase family protein [Alkalihalobacillus sp. BA299]|uniref:glycerophosphodiester phosphodiesterase n=1 Tax=Alkalihalobacillus sp. BA299 TaxID=2815938 RepID=UPI001ADC0149|nr:glycerophosphodiester phosphodiesterase family protein [Alkalihalobacillus sp. BA299]